MSRQFKITLVFLFVGAVVLGTIFAQKKPPDIPLAVTIYDSYFDDSIPPNKHHYMVRSDGVGEYINGVEGVTATINSQYGELNFLVPKGTPRRVLLEFNEATKEICPNECLDGNGNPLLAPGLGEVNYFGFWTFSRSAWRCPDVICTRDFLHMTPGETGHTNIRLDIESPRFPSKARVIRVYYSKACDNWGLGVVYFEVGPDHNGDGWADEWDLYPVPLGYAFSGDIAHVWALGDTGKDPKCNLGRYHLPFRIHLRKL